MCQPSTLTDKERNVVDLIYEAYTNVYGFPQGLCKSIAREIKGAIGGKMVGGFIEINHATHRQHWWVNRNGTIIDPMTDELRKTDAVRHITVEEMNRVENKFKRSGNK